MTVDEVLKFYGRTLTARIGYYLKFVGRFILEKFAFFCFVSRGRVGLHRMRGVNIGEDVYIGADVIIDRVFPDQIYIGAHSSVGDYSIISAHANIPMDTPVKELYPREVLPVKIGKGVWMMPQVVITPGVNIGDYSVVATGSVIINDIPPMVMIAGVPAKIKKDLENKIRPLIPKEEYKKLMEIRKKMNYGENK